MRGVFTPISGTGRSCSVSGFDTSGTFGPSFSPVEGGLTIAIMSSLDCPRTRSRCLTETSA
jgi:hypothetical protein